MTGLVLMHGLRKLPVTLSNLIGPIPAFMRTTKISYVISGMRITNSFQYVSAIELLPGLSALEGRYCVRPPDQTDRGGRGDDSATPLAGTELVLAPATARWHRDVQRDARPDRGHSRRCTAQSPIPVEWLRRQGFDQASPDDAVANLRHQYRN